MRGGQRTDGELGIWRVTWAIGRERTETELALRGAWDARRELCTEQNTQSQKEGRGNHANETSFPMVCLLSVYSVLLTLKHKTKGQIHRRIGN